MFCAPDPRCQVGQTSVVEYIRRTAQDLHYSDLDERAAELGAKVDAGDWSELDFGSS
jgi:hypothetical protein